MCHQPSCAYVGSRPLLWYYEPPRPQLPTSAGGQDCGELLSLLTPRCGKGRNQEARWATPHPGYTLSQIMGRKAPITPCAISTPSHASTPSSDTNGCLLCARHQECGTDSRQDAASRGLEILRSKHMGGSWLFGSLGVQ